MIVINDEYYSIRKLNDWSSMKFIGKFWTSVLMKFPDSRLYGLIIRIPLGRILFLVSPNFYKMLEDD